MIGARSSRRPGPVGFLPAIFGPGKLADSVTELASRWIPVFLLLAVGLPLAVRSAVAQSEPSAFRTLGSGEVTVRHVPRDSARADRVLRYLSNQPPLPGLDPGLPRDVEVYLAPDRESFEALAGGEVPEWGAGVAVPRLGRIVMPTFGGANTRDRTEERVLRHEWAHVGLGQAVPGLRIPRWFNEGYAEWASGGWNASEGWRLRLALAAPSGPTLDSLTLRWPRDRASAQTAYLLSGTAVEYLVRSSGERGLTLLVERWRTTGSFEDAFRSVYGVTTGQFEEDWREYVADRYGWLFVLSHSFVFWLFLTLALLVLFWIRRRRDRTAMARLRATEPPPVPAWWDGFEETQEGRRGPNEQPSESRGLG